MVARSLLIALLLVSACGSSGEDGGPPQVRSALARDTAPAIGDGQLAALTTSNAAFGADVYRWASGTPGNLFFSPHSISTVMAMLYAGAADQTATQIAGALHFTPLGPDLHPSFNALDLALAARNAEAERRAPFRLETTNTIFGQEGTSFEEPFLDALAVHYGAGVRVLDFAADPEGSRTTINAWISELTNARIPELLAPGTIDPMTHLVLSNAIYFSAGWEFPFREEDTREAPFQLATGPVPVPTLHGSRRARYVAGEGYQAVEIPYETTTPHAWELSMIVVLPDDLAAFEPQVTGAMFAEIVAGIDAPASEHIVDLALPKFRFDAELDAKAALRALGVTDLFTPSVANLSGIDVTNQLFVTDLVHQGFVGIDERGTEAAAATAGVAQPASAPPPATMRVDRPFLFFIRDQPTGAVLFVGRVVDPRS